MVANRLYAQYFYESKPSNLFQCRYCSNIRKQAPSNGYTNLVSHLNDKHPQYLDDYAEYECQGAQQLDGFGFVTDKPAIIYNWMTWVIARNLPLSEVDNETTRFMSRWDSISSRALKKFMAEVERMTEEAIAAQMLARIGLVFDGWTSGTTCYVAVYAVYAVYVVDGSVFYPLLALSPLVEETDLGADSHFELIDEILETYQKSRTNIVFIVGDNCSTNQAVATRLGRGDMLEDVNTLVVQLRTKKNSAHLRKHTELAAVKRNTTRWSSTFKMVKRYLENKAAVKQVESVEDLVPGARAHRKIEKLFEQLRALESVNKKLQCEDTSKADVRVLFDGVIQLHPVMESYLSKEAHIVRSPDFENGIVKIYYIHLLV
ncbi:hypothetical protein PPTG_03099 [Phytophthora nicotianae INRA-310]|uniref:BED-type domain-containing protein n=1 Tax=Phytophthora nicotianae (strain INRA-310) TaxID=761204 RepID=W2R5K4_PHYN3|nr:hypothetical protein PPTG_03099 [Phytophthora nicotianae INRA-310]ETN19999.1 hypothetical protein PPTG_03099 [Phytophthora nicotianae INRA-310]